MPDELGCKKIGSQITSIGREAFPATLETIEIDNNNFVNMSYYRDSQNNTSLKTLTLGPNVTAVPENAFKDCSLMKKVTMPSGLTSIGNGAFSGCSALEDVYALMLKPLVIDASVFEGVQLHGICDLHVIQGSGPRYRAMDVWKEFTMIFEDAGTGGSAQIEGDLDDNGFLEVNDVVLLADIAMGGSMGSIPLSVADMDGNGQIEVNDVVILAGLVMGS